jgi:hypothetical protein
MMHGMKAVQPRLTYPELRFMPDDGKRYELIDWPLIPGWEIAAGNLFSLWASQGATLNENGEISNLLG